MKKQTKKIISVLALGKLATASTTVGAGGLGKIQDTHTEQMSLDQVPYPLEILRTPVNVSDATLGDYSGSKAESSDSGVIFLNDLQEAHNSGIQPRIDFVVGNIHSHGDIPVFIFLAYSTELGSTSEWADLGLDGLRLGRENVQILSGFAVDTTDPIEDFNENSTPLGSVNNDTGRSVVIPLDLNDLDHADFDGNNIYFQVISIPIIGDDLDLSAANVSEVDHYTIERSVPDEAGSGSKIAPIIEDDDTESCSTDDASDDDSDTGSKGDDDSGSKTESDSEDTGGK